jgi:hypothetical protein
MLWPGGREDGKVVKKEKKRETLRTGGRGAREKKGKNNPSPFQKSMYLCIHHFTYYQYEIIFVTSTHTLLWLTVSSVM